MCAAKFIQAVVRGRQSRLRILSQRRSTQLLLKWAGTRIALSVSSQRERWQAQADARPLLLRPDSHFMAHWKLLLVATVVLAVGEVAEVEGVERSKALRGQNSKNGKRK